MPGRRCASAVCTPMTPTAQLAPELGRPSYTVSEDGLTYTFTMQRWPEVVRRRPSWTPTTSMYTLEARCQPRHRRGLRLHVQRHRGLCRDNLDVTASEDGKTLTVVLTAPCAYFLDLAAFPTFYAVYAGSVEAAEGYLADDGSVEPRRVGARSGLRRPAARYTLTEWKHNESMVYTKNPNYWDADNVKHREARVHALRRRHRHLRRLSALATWTSSTPFPPTRSPSLQENPEFHIIDQPGHLLRLLQRQVRRSSTARPLSRPATCARRSPC